MNLYYYLNLVAGELDDAELAISKIKNIGYYMESNEDRAYQIYILRNTCNKLEVYCRALRDKLNESE